MKDDMVGGAVTVSARRIGLIADIHCEAADGSDLPDAVFAALHDVDLVIDLGHTGTPDDPCRGVLDRLEKLAPVLAVRDFYVGPDGRPFATPPEPGRVDGLVRIVEVNGVRIGAVHNLERDPGPSIPTPPGGLPELAGLAVRDAVTAKFGGPVDIVAYGGTHRPAALVADGVLFVNPGSPTYPKGPGRPAGQRALGTVGVLTVDPGAVSFETVDLQLWESADA